VLCNRILVKFEKKNLKPNAQTMSDNSVEQAIIAIYDNVKLNMSGTQLDIPSLMSMLPQLMEAAGKYQQLDGTSKKGVVIGVTNCLIADNVQNPDLAMSLQQIVPTACDILYACWKKRYVFAQEVKGCIAICKKH
jgi:hypothetical protein